MRTVVDSIAEDPGGGTLTVLDADGGVTELTWAGVHLRARRIATVLLGDGFGPGCRVGLLADTGVDLVVTLQAVWLIGGAVTVLPTPAGRDRSARRGQIRAVVADAGLNLVVFGDGVPAELAAPGCPVAALPDLVGRSAGVAPVRVIRPDPGDLAVLQYTSGSTRLPRGVPVSHAHLAANLVAIRRATGHQFDHPGPLLSWLPLYHDMGLIGALALSMSCGCSAVLVSPVLFARRPAVWLAAIERYRPTWTGGPNFAFGLLSRMLRASPAADLSSLRQVVLGGEPVQAGTMAAFLAAAAGHGLDPSVLTAAYGLAEATLAVTCQPRGRGLRYDEVDATALEVHGQALPAPRGGRRRALVRLGGPVPGVELRIVDRRSGVELAARHVGRVEVRGASVVGRYWGEPPPPAGSWLRTGDIGYLAEGELVLCGREKDVVFAAGRNVYPSDVEAAVAAVPGVRAGGVAAFGVAGTGGDRLVVAVESVDRQPEVVRRAVRSAVLDEVGLTPAEVAVLPPRRLPKTSSGKLRRAETRRRYESGELTDPAG
nr:AMP-binding protein [Micromonospora sp. DSM 115978]